jgi:hypothetical protein
MVHRQAIIIVSLLFGAGTSVWLLAARARTQVVQAGFWFEDVTFDASEVEADRLGGGITREELARIQWLAMSELRAAFAGMRIAFTADRDATFCVRVAQTRSTRSSAAAASPANHAACGRSAGRAR